ncbi:hypothetical protein WDW86_12825 [Bdellovibrionota bacterium FG-2]
MRIAVLMSLFCVICSVAAEVDEFTLRFAEYHEVLPILDQEVNRRLDLAVEDANQFMICDDDFLILSLKEQFLRPFRGQLEGWADRSPEVFKQRLKLSKSVYQDIKVWQNAPVHLGRLGLASVIQLNGVLVGTDKIGHFFDEGFEEFSRAYRDGGSIEDALQYGVDSEEGFFGLATTGVNSFGDRVANFNGMHFWERALGLGAESAYIVCDGKTWKRAVLFTFADFVDSGWDEAINCSSYRDAKFESHVRSRIEKLEAKFGRPLQCPLDREACVGLAIKYGDFAAKLLHPDCLK